MHHPCLSLSSPGTYVTRAEATDADDPETDNAALRYSILEQGSPQLFSIDEHTGDIRTVQVGLDREVRLPIRWPTCWGPGQPLSHRPVSALVSPLGPNGGSSSPVGTLFPGSARPPKSRAPPLAIDTHDGFGHIPSLAPLCLMAGCAVRSREALKGHPCDANPFGLLGLGSGYVSGSIVTSYVLR